jgi:hypothetical protein
MYKEALQCACSGKVQGGNTFLVHMCDVCAILSTSVIFANSAYCPEQGVSALVLRYHKYTTSSTFDVSCT